MNNPWDEINIPATDVYSRLVDQSHPIDFFWARDHLGRYLFIYRGDVGHKLPDKFPSLTGIEIISAPELGSGRERLFLLLKDRKDWEIFLTLCRDLLASTRDLTTRKAAPEIVLRRLNRWQEFLRRERSHLMSESEIKGLIGELGFLIDHIKPAHGIGQAVMYWQGPEDLPQDFNVHDTAIEVKCQLGTTSPKVRISSAEQLCSQLPKNYLYVVTLGRSELENPNAINLFDMVELIRSMLESDAPDRLEKFNNMLYQTRYIDNEEYRLFSYLKTGEQMYKVSDGFPRICPESIPTGIYRLTYDLDLVVCEEFIESPEWINLS